MVKVYQSHPGTDLPEAAYAVSSGNKLMDSINITQRNIALLKTGTQKDERRFTRQTTGNGCGLEHFTYEEEGGKTTTASHWYCCYAGLTRVIELTKKNCIVELN